ncbi:unnamed protein product [Clavelina lepadiformis]|uniref:Phospholipase A2 n=1 Tax=Clavelina lepadiformis TaxID=159417 RepID=A0ABP0F119_CLALP
MFQAEETPRVQLTVRVICGRNIVNQSIIRTMDPYVQIHVKGAPQGRKQTRHVDNTSDPEWNEEFVFLLPTDKTDIIAEITLMNSNIGKDGNLGTVKFDLATLSSGDNVKKTFDFEGSAQVDIEFKAEERYDSDLRLGSSLCDKEVSYRKARKQKIFHFMRELLQKHGKQNGPSTADEVPVIGVLGSGGGYRAMVGYAGVMKALHDTGILDCSMYVNGLSGSSWYLAALYANETFPTNGPHETNNDIRSKIETHALRIFIRNILRYRKSAKAKKSNGQPTSLTDYFGMTIGDALLGKEKKNTAKLSNFQEKIKVGEAPLPILTAIHVGRRKTAKTFHDWVEFSPFEIGIAKYGSFMDTKHFGQKFFRGVLLKIFEETPLHYMMGIWGSAFAVVLSEVFNKNEDKIKVSHQSEETELDIDINGEIDLHYQNDQAQGGSCCKHLRQVTLVNDDEDGSDDETMENAINETIDETSQSETNDGSAISESKVTNQEESKSGAGFGNWFVDKITQLSTLIKLSMYLGYDMKKNVSNSWVAYISPGPRNVQTCGRG